MVTNKINRIVTLAANVGVLGGLILVAFQIHQNTEITKAQIANDYYLADMQLELTMMGESPATSWVKAIYNPDDLTAEDRAVVDRYFNYGMIQLRRLREMHDLGLADEDWETRISYLRWHLGNEIGRRWWAHSKEGFPDDFVRKVDDILAHEAHRGNQELLDVLKLETGATPNQ